MKKFYDIAGFQSRDGGFSVQLDGRPVKTPMGLVLSAPTRTLAVEIVREWDAQKDKIVPRSMPLTQLLNTAIDRVGAERKSIVEKLVEYAGADPICYYASEPHDLVQRQSERWGALAQWLENSTGIRLVMTAGITHVPQPVATSSQWRKQIGEFDEMGLTAFQATVAALGSVTAAYALIAGHLSAQQAFDAAFLDELYQMEKWGADPEITAKHKVVLEDVRTAKTFYDLTRKI